MIFYFKIRTKIASRSRKFWIKDTIWGYHSEMPKSWTSNAKGFYLFIYL